MIIKSRLRQQRGARVGLLSNIFLARYGSLVGASSRFRHIHDTVAYQRRSVLLGAPWELRGPPTGGSRCLRPTTARTANQPPTKDQEFPGFSQDRKSPRFFSVFLLTMQKTRNLPDACTRPLGGGIIGAWSRNLTTALTLGTHPWPLPGKRSQFLFIVRPPSRC
jgi:hypothetical protein